MKTHNNSVPLLLINHKHITLRSVAFIRNISQNLFQAHGINGFRHVRCYSDGSQFELTTSPEWFEHYMNMKYFDINRVEEYLHNITAPYILWDAIDKDSYDYNTIMKDAIKNFNGGLGFSIIKKQETWTDLYSLSAPLHQKSINYFFLNNIDLLESLILQYQEIATSLINEAHKERYILPYSNNETMTDPKKLNPKNILSVMPIQYRYFDKPDTLKLTEQELKTIFWLNRGKTVPEIAMIFSRSKRTVEKNIIRLKEKLDCHTLFQMGQRIRAIGLDRLNIFAD